MMKTRKRLSNRGTTMVELIVTFALLSLFMVAATRVISYTTTIYYNAKGGASGLEVSTMISNKIVGMIEGAINDPEIIYNVNANSDGIKLTDSTESIVTISSQQVTRADGMVTGPYLNIHYEQSDKGSIHYEETDFKYDEKAYLGYVISDLRFSDPGSDYPDNVLKMEITLHSEKYGDYSSVYYIKAVNSTKVIF